ncbi:hypothetical protein J5U22_00610 [Saccharolobus shibatae]|uniref:Uncharacterized protein n=1 Tax=Saccharolobus shibatae TaxID=2286 RepID=A0A8F5GYG9_9CREN|nr:hypothetical protein J5U22_00610 [Saccharolobus shibatae]
MIKRFTFPSLSKVVNKLVTEVKNLVDKRPIIIKTTLSTEVYSTKNLKTVILLNLVFSIAKHS